MNACIIIEHIITKMCSSHPLERKHRPDHLTDGSNWFLCLSFPKQAQPVCGLWASGFSLSTAGGGYYRMFEHLKILNLSQRLSSER